MKITFELDTNNPEENLDAVFAVIKNCFPVPAQTTKTEPRTQDEENSVPEFDDTGVPYDPRIHSTPAKINTDGRWRRRKNIEDAAFHHVMSEIVPPPPPPVARGSVVPKPPVTTPAPQNEFTKMMLRVSDLLTKGLLTHEKIEQFTRSINCTVNGKGMIAKLKDKPDLIPLFNNLVEDHVRKTAPK